MNVTPPLPFALKPPVLMGIVNVTPNSFSDTGAFISPEAAIAHGRQLFEDGATILDLGAEASSFFRPGVEPINAEEQLRRLTPVIRGLRPICNTNPLPLLSIDTRSAQVARQAIALGANLINDISAGTGDMAMFQIAAALHVPIVLMHISPGYPATPTTDDRDITQTVTDYLLAQAALAMAAGIGKNGILFDPGLGFGKTVHDNWQLVLELPRLMAAGFPVVLGASRKRFLTELPTLASPAIQSLAATLSTLAHSPGAPQHECDLATAVVTAYAAQAGVPIHRVHNVALCLRALAMIGLVG